MKLLGILTWLIVSIIGSALLNSWALAKLWTWFVAVQYGAGPSFGAWFGLAAIARLVLASHEIPKSDDDDVDATKLVAATLRAWAFTLIAVGLSWIVGAVAGWLP